MTEVSQSVWGFVGLRTSEALGPSSSCLPAYGPGTWQLPPSLVLETWCPTPRARKQEPCALSRLGLLGKLLQPLCWHQSNTQSREDPTSSRGPRAGGQLWWAQRGGAEELQTLCQGWMHRFAKAGTRRPAISLTLVWLPFFKDLHNKAAGQRLLAGWVIFTREQIETGIWTMA